MKKNFLFIPLIAGLLMTSCTNSGEKNEQTTPATDSANTTTAAAPAKVQFNKEVTYDKYKFTVTTQGEADQHHFKLIPQGLTVANDTLSEDVKGTIADFLIQKDIDILAMLSYKHNFFENLFGKSLIKTFAFESDVPILALHE